MISDLLSQLQPFVVMVLATALQSLPLVVGVAGTCRPKFFDPCSGDIVTEQECRERNLGCQWRPQESKTCAYGINCTSFESYSHCYFAKAGCYWDWDPILSPISTTNNNVDDTDEGGSTSENYLLLLFLIVILVLFVGIFHWYAHGDPHIRTGGGSSQGRPAEPPDKPCLCVTFMQALFFVFCNVPINLVRARGGSQADAHVRTGGGEGGSQGLPAEPPKRAPHNGNQNMVTASDTEEVVDDIEASIPMVSAEMILPKTTNDHAIKSMVVGATYSSNIPTDNIHIHHLY